MLSIFSHNYPSVHTRKSHSVQEHAVLHLHCMFCTLVTKYGTQGNNNYLGSSHLIWPMMPSIHIKFSRTTEKNCTLSVTEVTWIRLASQELSSSFHASITSCSLTIMASAFSPAQIVLSWAAFSCSCLTCSKTERWWLFDKSRALKKYVQNTTFFRLFRWSLIVTRDSTSMWWLTLSPSRIMSQSRMSLSGWMFS